MTMQAFTPAYLQREHTAPALLHSSEDRTMDNTWNEGAGRPQATTCALFQRIQFPSQTNVVAADGDGNMEEEKRFPNLPRPRGPEEYYKRAYDDLTKQIAYRWPNPGNPRHREGRIGGTWRHIKEVMGHGGNRFVFIDGLVSVYDDQKFTQKLQDQLPYRPHIRPLYAPVKGESMAASTAFDAPAAAVPAPTTRASHSAYPVLPQVPAASLARDPNVLRKLELQSHFPEQTRGFYRFGK